MSKLSPSVAPDSRKPYTLVSQERATMTQTRGKPGQGVLGLLVYYLLANENILCSES